ncbi:DNA topoisomerase I [Euryarchaeota archaeon ex4484_162]|nr:MAG: DNA topoisomerase I [Euryarchaeota archaeon ex4484_162]RLF62789.1 MAG: DNA topoisomerase I [Thermoplasmata archaeon]
MKLVICEKNIAAKRIAYILSKGRLKTRRIGRIPVYEFIKDSETWYVIGLKGHIVNLDYPHGFNQWTKIPPHQLINVEPCKKISNPTIASALKTLANKKLDLIIATDFDREGELIGVEAIDLLKNYNKKNIGEIKRARFSAITTSEVTKAFDKLVDVDYNLSRAAETRQIIDLVWGAVLTRFISLTTSQLGKDFLSIGRVQSPTLAILVKREKEIKTFVPKTYWQIIAILKKQRQFTALHCEDPIWEEEKAKKIYSKIKNLKKATVKNIKKTFVTETPPPPFNTTSFLQAASSLGFSASRAMTIAEELYMYGLTSYPRTDNTVYPSSLNIKNILQKLSKSIFSREAEEVIQNGRKTPTRGKTYATDHPPIHPVGTPETFKLNPEQQKIYELICRRFLATLAKDATAESTEATIIINGETFKTKGYKTIEPNWKNIYTYIKKKEKSLPELKEGETIEIKSIKMKEDQTKPPSRYTQGALIAKMEQLSLGTKSTRHEIISKLYSRKYITGSPPVPTSTAIAVIDALGDCDVAKPDMTAKLEKDMNEIATGKKTLEETVNESRKMLTQVLNSLEKEKQTIRTNIRNALREEQTIGKCPKCGGNMVIRTSQQGKRFVGCTNYPKCDNTYPLPQKGSIIKTNKKCSKCDAPIVRIKMKNRKPWNLCLNPSCPGKTK